MPCQGEVWPPQDKLPGVSAQLFAPLITPFNPDESVDFQGFASNIARYDATPLDGFLVNGTSAEAEMLSVEERVNLLRVAREATKKPIFAGVVASSVYDCRRQVEALHGLDLQALLIRTPGFYGSQFDQVKFYQSISSFSPIPVMVYQIPQYTGIKLSREVLVEISHMPNVVGIKDSLGDIALLESHAWPSHFRYFLGAPAVMRCGLGSGAAGGILGVANVVPHLCARLLSAAGDPGRTEEARVVQRHIIALGAHLSGTAMGLAGLKAACEIQGYRGGTPRAPLRPISVGQRETLATFLSSLPLE